MADKLYYDSATGATFKEAFADARAEGKKIFEWNGKKYNTKLKGEDEPKQGKVKENATIEAGKRQKSAPKDKEESEDKGSRGTTAGALAAATGLGAAAALSRMRKAEAGRKEGTLESMARERENRAKSGTSLRMPGAGMGKNDPYSMNLGSDTDARRMSREGGRGDFGRGASSILHEMNPQKLMKKGGKIRKFAEGGVTPAPKPPEPKKAPMPEWAKNARENRMRDQKVKKEQDTYEKGASTRLKEQGSFKKGGYVRSADGIAMRGKTKGRVI